MATGFTEFGDNVRRRLRRGEVLTWLVVVNIAVWIVCAVASLISKQAGEAVEGMLALSSDPHLTLIHPWTALTYMVTQTGFLHLLFNMLWLWWFGRIVADVIGGRAALCTYVAGGIGGGLLYMAIAACGFGFAGSRLVGSSASVLALMSVAAIKMPDLEFNLLIFGRVKLKWLAIVSVVLVFFGLGGGNAGGEVAHIGGVIVGVFLGLAYRRGRDPFKRFRSVAQGARNRRQRRANAAPFKNAMKNPEARLDELLDKIRTSGYASLTNAERNELTILSRKIKEK